MRISGGGSFNPVTAYQIAIPASSSAAALTVGSATFGGSASGTAIGVAAPSGFAGNLLDLQVNGASIFGVKQYATTGDFAIMRGYTIAFRTGFSSAGALYFDGGVIGYTLDSGGGFKISEENDHILLTLQPGVPITNDFLQVKTSAGTLLSGINTKGLPYAPGFISNLTGGGTISMGSGAPTTPNGTNPVAGDIYFRTDTPGTANQRIYICTTGGATPVWSGIL